MHVCNIRNMETRTHTQRILFALVFIMFPKVFIIRISIKYHYVYKNNSLLRYRSNRMKTDERIHHDLYVLKSLK